MIGRDIQGYKPLLTAAQPINILVRLVSNISSRRLYATTVSHVQTMIERDIQGDKALLVTVRPIGILVRLSERSLFDEDTRSL